jgi:hypothetical protein
MSCSSQAGRTCAASDSDVIRVADPVFAGLFVERLGRHVEAVVGPDERAVLDRDAREALGVAQRLEHAVPLAIDEADVADDAVLEGQAKPVLADDLDSSDVNDLAGEDVVNGLGHGVSLAQRVDRVQRLFAGGELPVGVQLLRVQLGPRLYEPQLPLRELAHDDLARQVEATQSFASAPPLAREAEALARSTDWDAAWQQLSILYARWQLAGSAGPEDDERLWRRFKRASDDFARRRAQRAAGRRPAGEPTGESLPNRRRGNGR